MADTELRHIATHLDDEAFARAEAYAATKRATVEELVDAYLRALGDDVALVPLPAAAKRKFLQMLRHRGRDTTVGYLSGGWEAFERPMPTLVFGWAQAAPGLIIDGGANTGFYSLLAASADPANRILAFEPDPAVRALLQQNVAANDLGTQITVREQALSERAGDAQLFIPSQDHGVIETSASLEPAFKSYYSEVVTVPVLTVDAALQAPELAGQTVSLIKIDVAGHEAAVLEGAEQTVAKHRPVLFTEVLDRADFGRLSGFIARHNYVDVPLWQNAALAGKAAVTWESGAWNHALAPAEKLPRFLSVARRYN